MSDSILSYFHIRRDERRPVLLSALFFFLVMTAFMMLRPARESLGMQRGMDEVRWLFIGTAVVTLAVNPVFGWLVSRFRRVRFIAATYGFFSLSLAGFWGLLVFSPSSVGERSGQVFYIWYSVFNLFSIMLVWALLADRFSLEQSRRVFPFIAAGGTLGAIGGPLLTTALLETGSVGTPALLLVSAGVLLLAVGAARAVVRAPDSRPPGAAPRAPAPADAPLIGGSAWEGFGAVLRSFYLAGIAVYVLVVAVVITFIYFTRLQMVDALAQDVDMRTGIFARLDTITQVVTLVVQLSVTGLILKRCGTAVALSLLPVTVMLGFLGLAIVSTLTMVAFVDAATKAVQRAVMRPARETLFTVVSRGEKYKAKAFIDTFVYRGGDVAGAQVEGALKAAGMGIQALAAIVVPLSLVWLVLGVVLGREQKRRDRPADADSPARGCLPASRASVTRVTPGPPES